MPFNGFRWKKEFAFERGKIVTTITYSILK